MNNKLEISTPLKPEHCDPDASEIAEEMNQMINWNSNCNQNLEFNTKLIQFEPKALHHKSRVCTRAWPPIISAAKIVRKLWLVYIGMKKVKVFKNYCQLEQKL